MLVGNDEEISLTNTVKDRTVGSKKTPNHECACFFGPSMRVNKTSYHNRAYLRMFVRQLLRRFWTDLDEILVNWPDPQIRYCGMFLLWQLELLSIHVFLSLDFKTTLIEP